LRDHITVNQPLVTIGVALYNHQDYIAECVGSLIEQNYSNLEIIIIDDGSTDDSVAVLHQFLESQENTGNIQFSTLWKPIRSTRWFTRIRDVSMQTVSF